MEKKLNKSNKVVFLLFCTQNYFDFLDKTLTNLQNITLQNCTIKILTDSNNLDLINKMIVKYKLDIETETDHKFDSFLSSSDGNYQYGNKNYNKLTQMKVQYIQRNLNKYKHVIYSDLDIAWFRNPIDYLTEISKYHDIAFQSESQSGARQTLCFGFVSIKSNIKTKVTFWQIKRELTKNSSGDETKMDQETLNELYKQNRLFSKKIFALPESLFINGLSYKLLTSEVNETYFSQNLEPFMFHANWVIGKEIKIRLLQKYGLWD